MRPLRLYRPTEPSACGYLSGQLSRSDYVDPRLELTDEELTELNALGFRRSGKLVYRPACPSCSACQSARFALNAMHINRRLKRTIKRCQHYQLAIEPANFQQQHYELYAHYIRQRHSDGAMHPPTEQQYREFICSHFGNTALLTLRFQQNLIGCLVFDRLLDGVSSVYCYFDPAHEHNSPGRYLIYSLSQLGQALNLRYHYLGYYIAGCRKMLYKAEWQPLELQQHGHWRPGSNSK